MWVSTKCLVKRTTAIKVVEALKKGFGDNIIDIVNNVKKDWNGDNMWYITFWIKSPVKKDWIERRELFFIEKSNDTYDEIPKWNYSRMSLWKFWRAVEIMKTICEQLKNGYIDADDCDSVWFELYNLDNWIRSQLELAVWPWSHIVSAIVSKNNKYYFTIRNNVSKKEEDVVYKYDSNTKVVHLVK